MKKSDLQIELKKAWDLIEKKKFEEAKIKFIYLVNTLKDFNSFFGLATVFFRQNHYEQAIIFFKKSISLKEDWNCYLALGWSFFRQGKYSESIEPLIKSISLHKDWNNYQALGSSYLKTLQFKEAIVNFKESLSLKVNSQSYRGIGMAYKNLGDYKNALDSYHKSLNLEENWEAYKNIGIIYFELTNYSQSMIYSKKSVDLKSDWENNSLLAKNYLLFNKIEAAINYFNASIKIKKYWETYYGLGYSYLKLGELNKAIESFCKSNKLRENWDSYCGLGISYHRKGLFSKAIDSFRKSMIMNQNKDTFFRALDSIQTLYPDNYNSIIIIIKLYKKQLLIDAIKYRTDKLDFDLSISLKSKLNSLVLFMITNINFLTSRKFNIINYPKLILDNINLESIELNIKEKIKRSPSKEILSFGDSHGEIFNCSPFVSHYHVPGATAYNLVNESSSSQGSKQIFAILNSKIPQKTKIILTFGEIDLRVHIFKQAIIQKVLPEYITYNVIKRYFKFVDKLISKGFIVIVNGPHCGGGSGDASIPISQRNEICEYMNLLLYKECLSRGIRFVTLFDLTVDKFTKENNLDLFRDLHHLDYPSTNIGKKLQMFLLSRILLSDNDVNKIIKVDQYKFLSKINKYPLDSKLNGVFYFILSNIPGFISLEKLLIKPSEKLTSKLIPKGKYYAIIKLPLPSEIIKINLEINLTTCANIEIVTSLKLFREFQEDYQAVDNCIESDSITTSKSETNLIITHHFSNTIINNLKINYALIELQTFNQIVIDDISVFRHLRTYNH